MIKNWTAMGLLVLSGVLVARHLCAQWRTPWSYEGARGPDHWSELDPDYAPCNSGKQQSPIDIRNANKAELPRLRFEYKSAPRQYLINNGYTIRVNYHDAPGTGSFLVIGDKRYHLIQFHFHHPSEEYIDGKQYDMVFHLMHEGSDGNVVGVAVFIKAGRANAMVQQLWDHMPRTKSNEIEIPGVEINPASLLPQNTSYYTYVGSQTAPPCTEVTWFILKTPVEISAEQIKAFSELYPHDVRPLQPLNGRVVKQTP